MKNNIFIKSFLVITLIFLFSSCGKQVKQELPNTGEIEIVESVPVETSPDNSDLRKTQTVWLEMFNAAKVSIDMEEYFFLNQKGEPLDDVIQALINAGKRGVKIRIIADTKMYNTYKETLDILSLQKNFESRLMEFGNLTGGIQHANYFIVDTEQIFIGCQGFDWRSLKHNHALGVRVRHHDFVKVYRDIFEHDWQFSNFNTSYPDFEYTDVIVKSFSFATAKYDTVSLIPSFSPIGYIPVAANFDETQVLRQIYNAKQSVSLQFDIYNPVGSDSKYYGALDSALMQASKRRIKVKLLISDRSVSDKSSEYIKKLASNPNIEIKYIKSSPELSNNTSPGAEQCKFIVSDSSSCWLGSCNAEKSSFFNNREAGVVINNRAIATRMYDIFMKEWNSQANGELVK